MPPLSGCGRCSSVRPGIWKRARSLMVKTPAFPLKRFARKRSSSGLRMTHGRSLLRPEKRRSAVSGSWASLYMVRGPGPKPKPLTLAFAHRTTAVLLLKDLGVLGAWELFPLRDLHHIGVDLQ